MHVEVKTGEAEQCEQQPALRVQGETRVLVRHCSLLRLPV